MGAEDTKGNGLFSCDAHYCTVDRKNDPTALACGMMQSGIRVFDVRNPSNPREIAYYNPGAQVGRNGSEHATYNFISQSSARAPTPTSPPTCAARPHASRDRDQLWVSCQDNGILALKFTNKAFRRP